MLMCGGLWSNLGIHEESTSNGRCASSWNPERLPDAVRSVFRLTLPLGRSLDDNNLQRVEHRNGSGRIPRVVCRMRGRANNRRRHSGDGSPADGDAVDGYPTKVSWEFSDRIVTIENQGQPIPVDVVESVLGNPRTCTRIEADWQLLEQAGVLQLSQRTADGERIAGHIDVPIRPAGHVRVNLGERQYNMFRGERTAP
jgi:hypothetical protein